jgi:ankyrin repeat protein
MNGYVECIEALIERGWDVQKQDSSGCTALHIAAKNGHLETVKWLVEQGVDVRIRSKKGNTARRMANSSGHMDIYTFLNDIELKKYGGII